MFPLRVVRFFFLQTSGRLRCLQTIWQNAITIYLFSMRFRRCRWTLAESLLLPSALRYVDDSGITVGSCLHRLLFALLSRCVHLDSWFLKKLEKLCVPATRPHVYRQHVRMHTHHDHAHTRPHTTTATATATASNTTTHMLKLKMHAGTPHTPKHVVMF